MNRYGACTVAATMLLTLAACGGNDAATPAASQPPLTSTTPTPTPTPKPTPKPVDPTTAAKKKILADYAASFAYIQKGIRYGGAGYAYETWMADPALTAMKNYMGAIKGVRGAKVTGDGKLLESKITAFDLKAKTATVTACVTDNYTAVAKNGVVVARPPGKIARVDTLKLLKGRWLVSVTDARKPEYGCKR